MDSGFCLVVNPAAGGGRGARALPAVLAVLDTAGAGVRVCVTSSLAHASELVSEAARRGETVVAVGGDGLVGVAAAAAAAAGAVLGVVPAGRGNDFARMLGVPRVPARAADVLVAGVLQAVNLIGVRTGTAPEQVVAGSVYLGVPSEAGEIANAGHGRRGAMAYQTAALRALAGWRPAVFTLDPDGSGALEPFGGFAVVLANSPYLAAGKRVAPDADVTDGLLDVVLLRDGHRLSFVRAMLMAGHGTHLSLSSVSTLRARAVTLTCDRTMPVGADGETLTSAAPLPAGTPLHVRALPGALRVLAPPRLP